jgi:hypothetical protein
VAIGVIFLIPELPLRTLQPRGEPVLVKDDGSTPEATPV